MTLSSGSSMGDIDAAFAIIDDDNLRAVDRHIAGQIPPQPTRRQIINEALREWAERNGLAHPAPLSTDAMLEPGDTE